MKTQKIMLEAESLRQQIVAQDFEGNAVGTLSAQSKPLPTDLNPFN